MVDVKHNRFVRFVLVIYHFIFFLFILDSLITSIYFVFFSRKFKKRFFSSYFHKYLQNSIDFGELFHHDHFLIRKNKQTVHDYCSNQSVFNYEMSTKKLFRLFVGICGIIYTDDIW